MRQKLMQCASEPERALYTLATRMACNEISAHLNHQKEFHTGTYKNTNGEYKSLDQIIEEKALLILDTRQVLNNQVNKYKDAQNRGLNHLLRGKDEISDKTGDRIGDYV